MSGVAPLTVNFDASGSFHTPPPSNVITSYTLDFGDGTAPVTQASPMFSHTYNSNGDYPARLTVTDPCGKTSTNAAQVVISVQSTLTKAVSRKFHPGFGNGDIDLPLVGNPRGVECRSTGNGAYTIVYSFLRNITAVDHATVIQGTATIDTANSTLGPLPNQYTVALTGVTNAQYLIVQLDGVHDTAGAILNQAIAQVGILFGDVNASGRVDGTDVSLIRQNNFQPLTNTTGGPTDTIREDINVSGRIDGTDVSFARQQNFTVLPSSP
jgi:PKD repeat protein